MDRASYDLIDEVLWTGSTQAGPQGTGTSVPSLDLGVHDAGLDPALGTQRRLVRYRSVIRRLFLRVNRPYRLSVRYEDGRTEN